MSGGSSSAAVLVGGAVCTQHPDADQRGARTTLDLMVDAARAAAADALATDGPGVDRLLGEVAWVGVPEGTWPAPDPGRLVADALGLAGSVPTVWAAVGVTQQELIASAVAAVADGARAALVVGGEAKARRRLLERAGTPASEIETAQHPDAVPTVAMRPGDLGVDDLEQIPRKRRRR